MRVILYAGKGGVGKTSIAAATGSRLAKLGYKTIVMSLDAAHSLSDSFDLDRGLMNNEEGKKIKADKNLWIQEIDVQEEIEKNWGEVYHYISSLLNVSGLDEILAEELAIFPGMEEVSALLYINQYIQRKEFDVIILDCAPTGESLRFISMPTTLKWYMDKLFKVEKHVAKVVRPIMNTISSIPLPDDSYFEDIERLYLGLKGIDELMVDPKVTTVRLITNPEKVVLKETQRAFMYFCLYGLCIDAVIINRIIPVGISDEFFDSWKDTQEKYISAAEKHFAPVPIWRVSLFDNEILGKNGLHRLAQELYEKRDPANVYFSENPYRFSKHGDTYHLTIRLPFITKEDIDLSKKDDELIVRIGGFKRHVSLPRALLTAEPRGAKISDNDLIITFGGNHGTKKKS